MVRAQIVEARRSHHDHETVLIPLMLVGALLMKVIVQASQTIPEVCWTSLDPMATTTWEPFPFSVGGYTMCSRNTERLRTS